MKTLSKPINKEEFWADRIKDAEKNGHIHTSVFDCKPEDWEAIAKVHQEIIKKEEVSGKILDAGCGYGRASEWFNQYVGVDFSPEFIDKAKELHPDAIFFKRDLKKMEFDTNVFDWAICISMKRMIVANLGWGTWGKIEEELRRVAKNVIIFEYSNPYEYEIIRNSI
jgi:SAM-dependent methyltransferase